MQKIWQVTKVVNNKPTKPDHLVKSREKLCLSAKARVYSYLTMTELLSKVASLSKKDRELLL